MKLLVFIALLSTAPAHALEPLFCNGQPMKVLGENVFPTGVPLKQTGDLLYPNGQVIKKSGSVVFPSGVTILQQGEFFYPNGQRVREQGDWLHPTGRRIQLAGECVYPDGQPMGRGCPEVISFRLKHENLTYEGELDTRAGVFREIIHIEDRSHEKLILRYDLNWKNGTVLNMRSECS